MKSRIFYTGKNIFWGYVSSIATILLSFITRTAFIYTIGSEYLGINGLFTSVLGVLSLTELGIGAAINFSLYKPVAEGNREKIKSLMQLYKVAYRWIAAIVFILGLCLVPFLNNLIKGAQGIIHLKLYYLIFLFNTVSSYFVSYKYGLINAEQKNYIVTNITAIFNVVMNIVQIILIVIFNNYVFYLLTQAIFQLFQKIYMAFYINNKYPYLREKNTIPLSKEEKTNISKNVRALIFHKIGEISVNQTDNIIISAFINIITVGLVSNYMLIISTVNIFVNIIFNGMIGSLGNLFAVESKEKQFQIFKVMDFVGYWIFSFSSVSIISLIQPFIELMWGREYNLPIRIVGLMILNNYMVGLRISVNNIKVAGGIFEQDKYLAIIQSVVNLMISIILAKKIGLVGVYIGTIVSGLIPSLIRPYIVYKYLLKRNSIGYYISFFIRFLITVIMTIIFYNFSEKLMFTMKWSIFSFNLILITILFNLMYVIFFYKTEEFKYLIEILKKLVLKLKGE